MCRLYKSVKNMTCSKICSAVTPHLACYTIVNMTAVKHCTCLDWHWM